MKFPLIVVLILASLVGATAAFGQATAPLSAADRAKKLVVEWKHLDQLGQTCLRCSATGKTLVQVIDEMKAVCASQGIEVTLLETRLTVARLGESNHILLNGTPMETLLPQARVFESDCPSCASLTGQPSCCRGIAIGKNRYEEIPEELIWQAASKVLGFDLRPGQAPSGSPNP